ncbi:MAG: ABC transporter ATP-binding protein [Clostridium sp.]|nr:ABC transporter ATP-binding protein [Clostridium sp.]
MKNKKIPLLEIDNLSLSFNRYKDEKSYKKEDLETIRDFSLELYEGEILSIVGSSGSGKSLLAHALLGILPSNSTIKGDIKFKGEVLSEKKKEKLRGDKIQLIPQSISYLDPLMKIERQVRASSKTSLSHKRQRESFEKYSLHEKTEDMYPFQLSGGMARRVLLSIVDQKDSDIIIADEPTPGLELDLAMKTLKHFREFADKGKGVLLITHDLDLALKVSDRVAVFYGGSVIEIAPVSDFIKGEKYLRHPYTKALFNALPQNGFKSIPGVQPLTKDLGSGCAFYNRCNLKTRACKNPIEMIDIRSGKVRCIHAT